MTWPYFVMAGLDPAIHVFPAEAFKAWMPVTSTGMTMFGHFPPAPLRRGRNIVIGLARRRRRFRDPSQMTYVKSRNRGAFRHLFSACH